MKIRYCGSRAVPSGRTDGRTEMTRPVAAFSQVANAHYNTAYFDDYVYFHNNLPTLPVEILQYIFWVEIPEEGISFVRSIFKFLAQCTKSQT